MGQLQKPFFNVLAILLQKKQNKKKGTKRIDKKKSVKYHETVCKQ